MWLLQQREIEASFVFMNGDLTVFKMVPFAILDLLHARMDHWWRVFGDLYQRQGSSVVDKSALRAASRQTAKSKNGHVTITTPILGWSITLLVTLDVAYLCKKFDDSSFSYSWDMIGALKFKVITWLDHAHFRDGLSSVGQDMLCSTRVPNLYCLRLPATKIWKATQNVEIVVVCGG